VSSIAAEAGVPARVVRAATRESGPFPSTGPQATDSEVQAWVALRAQGVSTETAADHFGVRPSTVRKRTRAFGPFPKRARWSNEDVDRWVQSRHAGISLAMIGARESLPPWLIAEATKAAGPFRAPRKFPPDMVGIDSIAAMCNVAWPTVASWLARGHLPPADAEYRGRPTWKVLTIRVWLSESGMARCPQCGARCRSVSRHAAHTHRK
ncbi:MAG: hypothetical protein KDB18_14290, partial [Salinibacterium sp.]|nr:hypothetical protein [Salinibacterium sp.]